MKCTCCVSLKLFESCFKKFEEMKNSEEVQKETEIIISNITKSHQEFDLNTITQFLNDSQRIKALSPQFIDSVVKYIIFSKIHSNIQSSIKINDPNILKKIISEVFSILHFCLFDRDFFYHFLFQTNSEKGLIKQDKICSILKLFSLNNLEFILLIPAYSFIRSNYLSNCEFVNYFKAVQNASITNDFSAIYNCLYDYLYEDDGLTIEVILKWMETAYSNHLVDCYSDRTIFSGTVERIFRFVSIHSNQNSDNNYSLTQNEFGELATILFKLLNRSLTEDVFIIAYKRQDPFFAGVITKAQAINLLDDITILFPHINKESVINAFDEVEISYFKLLSIIQSTINLSNLVYDQ